MRCGAGAKRPHVYVITWAMMTLALPWAAVLLFREGMPAIQPGFYKLLSVVPNMISVTLEVKALSLSPLSLTVPFLAFTPLFMLVTSLVVLGEAPDAKGLAGIVLVATGAYAINLEKVRGGLLYAPAFVHGLRKNPVGWPMVPRLFLIGLICAVMILSQFAAMRLALATYVGVVTISI